MDRGQLQRQRLFTALLPPPSACAAIDAERRRWMKRAAERIRPAVERLHLTLQFHDAVDREQEQAWIAALTTLRFSPFEIVLTHAQVWMAPRGAIVVLRARPSAALMDLQERTASLAAQAGLAREARPFKPHVTVLRTAERVAIEALSSDVSWRAREVALVWSDLQAKPPCYRLLASFGSASCEGKTASSRRPVG